MNRHSLAIFGLLAGALTAALAGSALTQVTSASVFISPSGEPFRARAGAPAPFDAWFARADANHDGRIDRAEFQADAMAFFKRLDVNGDGIIDGFEISAYEKTVAPELTSRADEGEAGHDAYVSLLNEAEPVSGADLALDLRITAAEWRVATDRRFDSLDVARTGFLGHDALLARLPKPGKPRRRQEVKE